MSQRLIYPGERFEATVVSDGGEKDVLLTCLKLHRVKGRYYVETHSGQTFPMSECRRAVEIVRRVVKRPDDVQGVHRGLPLDE